MNWKAVITLTLVSIIWLSVGLAWNLKGIETQANKFIVEQQAIAMNNTCYRQCVGIGVTPTITGFEGVFNEEIP